MRGPFELQIGGYSLDWTGKKTPDREDDTRRFLHSRKLDAERGDRRYARHTEPRVQLLWTGLVRPRERKGEREGRVNTSPLSLPDCSTGRLATDWTRTTGLVHIYALRSWRTCPLSTLTSHCLPFNEFDLSSDTFETVIVVWIGHSTIGYVYLLQQTLTLFHGEWKKFHLFRVSLRMFLEDYSLTLIGKDE